MSPVFAVSYVSGTTPPANPASCQAQSSERIAVSVGSCALSSVRWQHSLRVLVSHLERRGILVRDAESGQLSGVNYFFRRQFQLPPVSQLHLQDEDSEDALGQLEST